MSPKPRPGHSRPGSPSCTQRLLKRRGQCRARSDCPGKAGECSRKQAGGLQFLEGFINENPEA
jgi:hypothetical protein